MRQRPQQHACPSSEEKEVPLGQNLAPCPPGALSALLQGKGIPPTGSPERP